MHPKSAIKERNQPQLPQPACRSPLYLEALLNYVYGARGGRHTVVTVSHSD